MQRQRRAAWLCEPIYLLLFFSCLRLMHGRVCVCVWGLQAIALSRDQRGGLPPWHCGLRGTKGRGRGRCAGCALQGAPTSPHHAAYCWHTAAQCTIGPAAPSHPTAQCINGNASSHTTYHCTPHSRQLHTSNHAIHPTSPPHIEPPRSLNHTAVSTTPQHFEPPRQSSNSTQHETKHQTTLNIKPMLAPGVLELDPPHCTSDFRT